MKIANNWKYQTFGFLKVLHGKYQDKMYATKLSLEAESIIRKSLLQIGTLWCGNQMSKSLPWLMTIPYQDTELSTAIVLDSGEPNQLLNLTLKSFKQETISKQ